MRNSTQQRRGASSRRTVSNSSTPVSVRTAPIARNYRVTPRLPISRNSGPDRYEEGDVEFASVSNTTTFTATRYELNPGLSTVFGTRLASIASGYEKYRMNLTATYVPAEAVTTTAGRLYMAAEYDPNDDAPASLQALSTYQTQRNGAVFDKVVLPFSTKEMFSGVQVKKLRSGPVPGDLTVHDPGSLIIATDSGANTNAIGKIWLHYQITFSSPQTNPTSITPRDLYVRNLNNNQNFTTATPALLDFDEAITTGFTVTDTSGAYTLPPGAYLITGEITFSDSSAENLSTLTELYVGGAPANPVQRNSTSNLCTAGGARVVPFTFFASFVTSTTIAIRVTLTGAAGTLAANADQSRLVIRAV